MPRPSSTRDLLLSILLDGKPRSFREIGGESGLSGPAVWNGLKRSWEGGWLLRTKEAIYETEKVSRGRSGSVSYIRPYHIYVLKPGDIDSLSIDGHEFVSFSQEALDPRGGGSGQSKALQIKEFLRNNHERAWFSKEISDALKDKGIKPGDVMSSVRRLERQRRVYVRGYRYHDRETPFKEGYLLTWVDEDKPHEEAFEEAIRRTNETLDGRESTNPMIQRVHAIKDMIFEATRLKDLIDFDFVTTKLGCTSHESKGALERTFQLYSDLRVVKLFDQYRYFYHSSMADDVLKAVVEMKANYIRKVKGRDNRIGHNWEAVPSWFIDKFTTGASFWKQNHRLKGMDSRRITIHLLKGVGGRRNNAEVDRVWEVTPGLFTQPITYVLECKWGLVNKRHVDDFFDVLKWSKDFGADTPEGRSIKQGVNGIFAASSFNPREKVHMKDGTEISLASYAQRMNIQLLRASDFNQKLHDRGCPNAVTVQSICRVSKNESEVGAILSAIWEDPSNAEQLMDKYRVKNTGIYAFEEQLREPENRHFKSFDEV